ncbi:MAG: glycosyltransferase family 4 protein [Bacteroidales bacterium]|nr:glycosyltransferase family 4 protein [Bacteroidales bacterium]
MNILLISHYAGAPQYGMEFRSYYMAREWVRQGHQVTVVGASFSHLRHHQPPTGEETLEGIHYLWLPTSTYEGNGLARVRTMFQFVAKVFRRSREFAALKPDIVIASSVYTFDLYPCRRIARLAHAKLVYEVHDLWPLSPMIIGGYSKWHPFIWLLQRGENYAYRHCDMVVSIIDKSFPHMQRHGLTPDRFCCIPNGYLPEEWVKNGEVVNGEVVNSEVVNSEVVNSEKAAAVNSQFTTSQKREQNVRKRSVQEPALETVAKYISVAKPSSLGLCRAQETSTKLIHNSQVTLPEQHTYTIQGLREQGKIILGFAGGHTQSTAMHIFVQAAKELQNRPDLAFLLVGDGPQKAELIQLAESLQLSNIQFLPPIPKNAIPLLLTQFDICYAGGVHSILHQYGTSFNKITDYMLAAKPIIFSVDEPDSLVQHVGCGIQVEAENTAQVVQAIEQLTNLSSEQRNIMGMKGHDYAVANLQYPTLAKEFLEKCKICNLRTVN